MEIFSLFFLATLRGIWNLSFPTRDWTLLGKRRPEHQKECLTGFNGKVLPVRVPRPERGRSRKSSPGLCWGVVYIRSLWGMVRLLLLLLLLLLLVSLQSCPTLCDPVDGSPLGSSVPGILQARILEWVAISFPNAWKWKVKMKTLSLARSPKKVQLVDGVSDRLLGRGVAGW